MLMASGLRNNPMQQHDVIIIGAGAAGLMCALRAGQRGKRVLLLDRADKVGSKILIAGGGRCNFTNLETAPNRYISNNKHFAISALKSYTQHDFIKLVEKHEIPYHEKTLGQLFCDGPAQAIVDMLLAECKDAGIEIRLNQKVKKITKTVHYHVHTEDGLLETPSLVLATGGPSIPKMGSSDFTYRMASQFGLPLVETKPSLVPLVFEGFLRDLCCELAGVSLDVIASIGKTSFQEGMVFTHRGISGPAILQISSYWNEGEAIFLNLLPNLDVEAHLIAQKQQRPKVTLKNILREIMPQRLATRMAETYMPTSFIGETSDKKLKEAAQLLSNWKITPSDTEGYAKAEVTRGGVDTNALSSKTMEARDVPGLYVIGEAVDVTGWLGGYNFQWAWSSGSAAGKAI